MEEKEREREKEKEATLTVSAKVFVGDPPVFDQTVFDLWLSNLSIEKATSVRLRDRSALVAPMENQETLLLDDTWDQYRTYNLLQHYLSCPMLFLESSPIPLAPDIRSTMIALYYDVDLLVARHILGKKLDQRRDYEDLVEATGYTVGYCRRHYENFRRVYKQVVAVLKSGKSGESGSKQKSGECGSTLTLKHVIQTHFKLAPCLAKKYSVIVFLCKHRFETLKKKLLALEFADFAEITCEMMDNWTGNSKFQIEIQFLDNLRHISEQLKESRVITEYHALMHRAFDNPSSDLVNSKFAPLLKTLLKISCRLTASKELRDLFLDIYEKVNEPYKSDKDLRLFLEKLIETYPQLRCATALGKDALHNAWKSFLRVVMLSLQKMGT